MKFSHLHIKKTFSLSEGLIECEKFRNKGFRSYRSLAFFYGFFDGFSTPTDVAHLAIEKEQSRDDVILCKCGSSFSSMRRYVQHLSWCPHVPNIREYTCIL